MKAKIITFDELDSIRDSLGTIVCTSGGYDPVHPGHLSCIMESRQFGDTVVVIVNGDSFLKNKKGKPFIDLATRAEIMSYVRGIDYVIPFEIENDQTVIQALKRVRPHVFTKGGDRIDETSIPEWGTCVENNIKVISGVGYDKLWSSSDFLKDWVAHHQKPVESSTQ
jgi:D-beta-D-heptose 7-phosphate kinase/D-beta-D-heptose 1-phosphate adenosyltransferase